MRSFVRGVCVLAYWMGPHTKENGGQGDNYLKNSGGMGFH